jgi:hypothetical protein
MPRLSRFSQSGIPRAARFSNSGALLTGATIRRRSAEAGQKRDGPEPRNPENRCATPDRPERNGRLLVHRSGRACGGHPGGRLVRLATWARLGLPIALARTSAVLLMALWVYGRTKQPAKGPWGGGHPAVTVVRSFSGASIMWSGSKVLPVPRIVTLP